MSAIDVAPNGDVVVGGWFTEAGGQTVNRVAKWDGTTWTALGVGMNNIVDTVAIADDGTVYAGGYFTEADGVTVNHVAKWDGTAWSGLGTGMNVGTDANVFALAISPDDDLYVGGAFVTAGGVVTSRIAKWDGTAWSALGTGMGGVAPIEVYALAVDGSGRVYAGGSFTSAGPAIASKVAMWDDSTSTWSRLGDRGVLVTNGNVDALAVAADGTLYAGGFFTTVGGVPANRIAQWDGTAWSALGSGMNGNVHALTIGVDGTLFAGGAFTTADGVAANRVAQWNGSSWSSLGIGVNDNVYTFADAADGTLYAGGDFTSAGGVSANYIASWPPASGSVAGASISYTDFTYHLPDGRECSAISPQRVQVGTMVVLPGVDALCHTMPGSTVAGWTIPVPLGFTGYGSATEPFPPGLRVRVIESQRFTVVPFDPVVQIDYDANIAADDTCVEVDVPHGSEDGRVAHVWVPRADFAMARTPAQAPCVPAGYELTGWNTRGDGSGERLGLGVDLPAGWETSITNHHTLYAVWRPD